MAEDDVDALLASLVESKRLSYSLKLILDRKLDWNSRCQPILSHHVNVKDKEIKRLCNEHYEEFVKTNTSLLTVKSELKRMRDMINDLNDSIQEQGEELIAKGKRYIQYRKIYRNITHATEVLQKCLYVITMANKSKEQVKNEKYFVALKTLHSMQRVSDLKDYHFATVLEKFVPRMIQTIKDKVRGDFHSWLQHLDQGTVGTHVDIGAATMSMVDEQLEWNKSQLMNRSETLADSDSDFSLASSLDSSSVNIQINEQERQQANPKVWNESKKGKVFDQLKVDFGAVFQCLHVYENLDQGGDFRAHYRDKRQGQLTAALALNPDMTIYQFVEHHTTYCARICGFFLIEDAILKSGNQCMQRSAIDQMWEDAMVHIKMILIRYLTEIYDQEVFLQVKYTIILFCRALENHGFNVHILLSFLASQKEKTEELLQQQFDNKWKIIIDAEKFEPMLVYKQSEYDVQILNFGLQDPTVNVQYPASMPFSAAVPQICRLLKSLISQYFEYSMYLSVPLDSYIAKYIDSLLMIIHDTYANLLQQPISVIPASQAAIYSVNTFYIGKNVVHYIEQYIKSKVEMGHRFEFHSQTPEKFQQLSVRFEFILREIICDKIDSFISLANDIKWTPSDALINPHDFIKELVSYLSATFINLMPMSDSTRSEVHIESCSHVARSLMALLLSPSVKAFNIIALHDLRMDLQLLISFAQRCPTANLADCFIELQLFLELFLSGDVENISDPNMRTGKYEVLAVPKLIKLFEKYRDVGVFATLPMGVTKVKKKSVEAQLKLLKKL